MTTDHLTDYPPLPEPALQIQWRERGSFNVTGLPILREQLDAGETADTFTADQMHAYVEADRKARATAEPDLKKLHISAMNLWVRIREYTNEEDADHAERLCQQISALRAPAASVAPVVSKQEPTGLSAGYIDGWNDCVIAAEFQTVKRLTDAPVSWIASAAPEPTADIPHLKRWLEANADCEGKAGWEGAQWAKKKTEYDAALSGVAPEQPKDTARLDWLERRDERFANIDRITSAHGKFNGFDSLRQAIDAEQAKDGT